MLKAQRSAGAAALAVTMLIAFSHVAVHTRHAAAVPPERPYVPAGTAPNSLRTFHTFDIEEVFSNYDGSAQYIELLESAGADGHYRFAGNQLRSGTNVFTYPADLPDTATAYRSVLIATAAFAALPGAVTPDYIIPERFFEFTGDTISIFEAQTNELVDTFVFGGIPQELCPCDADVDNNGVIDINDAACIMACRGGDCSCCVSSCDINCDGVVDEGDVADDIIYTPSAWLCQFVGGSADRCCTEPLGACCNDSTGSCSNAQFASSCDNNNQTWVPGLGCPDITCPGVPGACCDGLTGICTNDVLEDGCTAPSLVWTPGRSCAEVTCAGLPRGACCDPDRGICESLTLETDCAGGSLVWSEGLSCAEVSCPVPPVGACCNTGNGHCTDEAFEVDCTGTGLTWSPSTACSSVSCSVPPQDPCPCDADVNNDGSIDLNDANAIMSCRLGDCSGCLSSCDVNCDGVVDEGDIADDSIYTPSAWLCQFVGGSADRCCTEPLGACCNESTGSCFNAQFASSCDNSDQTWLPGVGCPDITCPGVTVTGAATGACCDAARGSCQGDVLEVDCTGVDLAWSQGLSCAAVSCPIPPDGACCNVGNGQCQDGVLEVDCRGIGLVWTASIACWTLSCVATSLPTDGILSLNSDGTTGVNSPTNFVGEMGSVNAAPPIPTMSGASLVVMMLLLVTAGVAITRERRCGTSPST